MVLFVLVSYERGTSVQDQNGRVLRPPAGVLGQLGPGVLSCTTRCCSVRQNDDENMSKVDDAGTILSTFGELVFETSGTTQWLLFDQCRQL